MVRIPTVSILIPEVAALESQLDAHHRALDMARRPTRSQPCAVGTFVQGDGRRRGVARPCAIFESSLAAVGGIDSRHRDANQRRTVAEGYNRLSRGYRRRRTLRA